MRMNQVVRRDGERADKSVGEHPFHKGDQGVFVYEVFVEHDVESIAKLGKLFLIA